MRIEHVLAVATVSSVERSARWYEQLFGRPPDNRPMDTLVEWRLTDAGWLQVFHDPDHAGSSFVNLTVDDLDAWMAAVASRGIDTGAVAEATRGVRLSSVSDPDGNTVTFIGGFRAVY